ncbi:MAG: hypothetical protein QXV60_02040 [Nitrososphaerota archaeon]
MELKVPLGFRWSKDLAEKAKSKGQFIKVGGSRTKKVYLKDAIKFWNSPSPDDQKIIFNFETRLAGTPEDVTTALKYAKFNNDEIVRIIGDSVTKDNYLFNQNYKNEMQLFPSPVKKRETTSLQDVLSLLGNVEELKIQGSKTPTKRKTKASPKPEFSPVKKAYENLVQGKVIDVSKLEDTGKGYRTVKDPKVTRTKVKSSTLPIITNDVDKYVTALKLIFGPDAESKYSKDIQEVKEKLGSKTTKKSTEKVTSLEKLLKPSSPRKEPLVKPSSPRKEPLVKPSSPRKEPLVKPSSPRKEVFIEPLSPREESFRTLSPRKEPLVRPLSESLASSSSSSSSQMSPRSQKTSTIDGVPTVPLPPPSLNPQSTETPLSVTGMPRSTTQTITNRPEEVSSLQESTLPKIQALLPSDYKGDLEKYFAKK